MKTAFRYTVLQGDTLTSIAAGISASAGITYQAIEAVNPGVPPTALKIGMLMDIPDASGRKTVLRYTVMEGDTYFHIAAQLAQCSGLTNNLIAAANPGMDSNKIKVGQVINIPASGSVPAPDLSTNPSPNPITMHTPSPSPVLTSSPELVPASGKIQIGFWRWTWGQTHKPPSGCNLGLAFSGWTDATKALHESSVVYTSVPDLKYITLGGGNANGAFNATGLQNITNAINAGKFTSYAGIAYDIEEGSSGLAAAFAQSFAAAKAKDLKVLVTISHSAPYGIGDAYSLMQSFFTNSNIDFLSPQLYTTGSETQNEYATSGGVGWNMYAGAKAKVIPSIVKANMFSDAQTYFKQHGVTLAGFIQWSQS
jgi:LysM repeat protein